MWYEWGKAVLLWVAGSTIIVVQVPAGSWWAPPGVLGAAVKSACGGAGLGSSVPDFKMQGILRECAEARDQVGSLPVQKNTSWGALVGLDTSMKVPGNSTAARYLRRRFSVLKTRIECVQMGNGRTFLCDHATSRVVAGACYGPFLVRC